jgi:hypothetical protein
VHTKLGCLLNQLSGANKEKGMKVLDVYRVLVGNLKEKEHLKDQGVDGRIGSKWTSGRLVGGWSGGLLAGCCECGDEPSGSGATELVYG